MNAEIFHKLMAVRQSRLIPTDGLVFYMPMDKTITTATVEGVAGVKSYKYACGLSDVTFETVQGVPCAVFAGTTGLYQLAIPSVGTQYTLSFWARPTGDTTNMGYLISASSVNFYAKVTKAGSISFHTYSVKPNADISLASKAQWSFCCVSLDGVNKTCWTQIGTKTQAGTTTTPSSISFSRLDLCRGSDASITYGVLAANGYEYNGCMAGFRLYNRALTDEEINALSKEFSPTE